MGAGYYATYFTSTDAETDIDFDEDGSTNEEGEEDLVVSGGGGMFEQLAGIGFNVDLLVFGVRGGVTAAVLKGSTENQTAQTTFDEKSATSVGGTVSAVFGVEF